MKKLLIVLGIILAIAVPLTAFAATSTSNTPITNLVRGFCRINPDDLSEQQKTELLNSFKQMMDAKKKVVNELVESGKLTEEDGEAIIQRIDERIEQKEENGFFSGGAGMRSGTGRMGKGRFNRGRDMSGSCPYLSSETLAN